VAAGTAASITTQDGAHKAVDGPTAAATDAITLAPTPAPTPALAGMVPARFGGTSNDEVSAVAVRADGSAVVTGYFANSATPSDTGAECTATDGTMCGVYVATTADCTMCVTAVNVAANTLTVDVDISEPYYGDPGWVGVTVGSYIKVTHAVFTCYARVSAYGGGSQLHMEAGHGCIALPTGLAAITVARFGVSFGGSTSFTSAGSYDIFVLSLNADGSTAWAKAFGGTSDDYGYAVAVRADGSAVVTGYFRNTVSFGGSTSLTSAGGADIFVLSLNADGSTAWAKAFGGTSSDYGYGVAVRADGSAVVTGNFVNTVSFDGSTSLTSAGNSDIFVLSLDADGSTAWAKAFGGTGGDYGHTVAVRADGSAVVTGSFQNTVSFGGSTSFTSAGSYDIFVLSLNADGSNAWS
jgi:hypothetical protein